MSLIEVKIPHDLKIEGNIHIHLHHVSNADMKTILESILLIKQKVNKMSEVNDQLLAAAQSTADSLAKIRVDIATLVSQTNPQGGLTQEEAQALLAKLTAIAGDAKSIDDLTADPAPAPEPAPEV